MQASQIFLMPSIATRNQSLARSSRDAGQLARKLEQRLSEAPDLSKRFHALMRQGKSVRTSEYHLTNACNIRCKGCWFFAVGHDKETRDQTDLEELKRFFESERVDREINTALVIGGEPTLFPERLRVIVDQMRYVTVSTNGLIKLPYEGFEKVAIGITLFGGGEQDDQLRAIRPNGVRFSGLFDQALEHYTNDQRAGFVYALTEDGIANIEGTVERIHSNGNIVTFNYYYQPGEKATGSDANKQELLREALRVKSLYPKTVISPPSFIASMITGQSNFGEFGYWNCPSISVNHPAHRDRLKNGNPILPRFNAWSSDFRTIKFCCTSGHCNGCRDSQAIYSWLLVNWENFLESQEDFLTWIEVAESYWSQFIWAPYHYSNQQEVE